MFFGQRTLSAQLPEHPHGLTPGKDYREFAMIAEEYMAAPQRSTVTGLADMSISLVMKTAAQRPAMHPTMTGSTVSMGGV